MGWCKILMVWPQAKILQLQLEIVLFECLGMFHVFSIERSLFFLQTEYSIFGTFSKPLCEVKMI